MRQGGNRIIIEREKAKYDTLDNNNKIQAHFGDKTM